MKILYGFIVIDVDDQLFERKTYHSTRMIKGRIGIHFRNHQPICVRTSFCTCLFMNLSLYCLHSFTRHILYLPSIYGKVAPVDRVAGVKPQ